MKNFKTSLIAMVLILSIIGLVGCKEKGPAEKAGEKLDKTMEDASKKANELLGK